MPSNPAVAALQTYQEQQLINLILMKPLVATLMQAAALQSPPAPPQRKLT